MRNGRAVIDPDRNTRKGQSGRRIIRRAAEVNTAGNEIFPYISPENRLGLQLASASMIVDALATSGAPDPGSMNRLYDLRQKSPLFAQAFLLHAMAVAKLPQSQLDTFAKELEGRLRVSANDATAAPAGPVYAPMLDSGARTTALVLRALLAVDPKHPLGSRLARGLLAARVDGAWRSTQDNVWALVALDAYRRAQESSPGTFEVKAYLGDTQIGHARFDKDLHEDPIWVPASKMTSNAPLTFSIEGTGKLFYAAELRYATTTLPTKPLDRGFYVEKRVRGLAAADLDAALKVFPKSNGNQVPKVKIGQLVLIDILLESVLSRGVIPTLEKREKSGSSRRSFSRAFGVTRIYDSVLSFATQHRTSSCSSCTYYWTGRC